MANDEKIRLTQYSRAGGCGCKVSSRFLHEVLSGVQLPDNATDIIAGVKQFDDAGVIVLETGQALILTTDVFTPIFDDPFDFGRVAAANAISDIYAMGGRPILAQAILGWPTELLPASVASRVIEGAIAICASVGVTYSGGHTIDTVEPLFGLCVNGVAPVSNIKLNSGARNGDAIYLTKPIGSGVISTAEKKALLSAPHREIALRTMARPNTFGVRLGQMEFVHALTDVTGFGLAGHLCEMCSGAGLAANIEMRHVQVLDGVQDYLSQGCRTGGGGRNSASFGPLVSHDPKFADLLFDPQTNGGLLIACDPSGEQELQQALHQDGLGAFASPIGRFVSAAEKFVVRVD